jgi:hypothetical protein
MEVRLRRWAAWSPGLEDTESWRRWSDSPGELESEGGADASFLPPLLRRRCGPLARGMLAAVFACSDEDERGSVATVFASRHGNINESIELLERVARRQPLSPTRFSHTVHNAQSGLFSIAAGNRQAASSIAAQEETFGCGWLEALTLLERRPERAVLLVVGDVPLAPDFAQLVDEPPGAYAVALLLECAGDGPPLAFRLEAGTGEPRRRRWPDACEFLRWWHSDEPRLTLAPGRRRWQWEKRPARSAQTTVA